MTTKYDYNKYDPEECNWCHELDDICPYHEGLADGWEYAMAQAQKSLKQVRDSV